MTYVSATQYNSLSASYDAVNDRPLSRAIVINIERLLAPHIRGARVLELACGTGFFTRHLLDWGAASVVGVDVSQAMVDVARTKFEAVDKCRFMVTDCAAPFDARGDGGEGFDLVFAAWLLNYAADEAQMTAMWENISSHLKPGGRLVAVVPHPEEDPIVCINHIDSTFASKYGYRIDLIRPLPLPKGYHVHLFFSTTPPVDFGTYYLPSSVYETAARAGGMRGVLAWEDIQIPDDYDVVNAYMTQPVPKGYFDEWLRYPDSGLLVVEKS